jgi:hypothetical protein
MDTEQKDDENDKHSFSSILLQGVIIFLVFYFGLFGLLLVDELVLHYQLLDKVLPGGAQEIIFIIYYPLILLVRFILRIP